MNPGNDNTTTDHANTPAPTAGHALIDDIELRPPLSETGDGVSSRDASILRPLLCRMYVACNVLSLSNEARFTSLVLLHRYFDSSDEMLSVEWKWIAAACLFLGTKTEEESRRLRDIINVAHMLEFDNASQDMTDHSLLETISVRNKPMALDEEYWTAKEKLVATEQQVLRMLRFDCLVSHPHRAVAVLLSEIAQDDNRELLSIAWRYLNQALFYAPALRHDVLTLACASIECAQTRLANENRCQPSLNNQEKTHWWLTYGVSDSALQACIHELQRSVSL